MKIIIVGCGIVGTALVKRLVEDRHDITVIDNDEEHVNFISNTFDVLAINGNAMSPAVLEEADAKSNDLLIAVTDSDEKNITICLFAKKLGVSNTISRVRDLQHFRGAEMAKEELGLSFAVNPELDAANEIFRSLRYKHAGQIETLAKGSMAVMTCRVKKDAPVCGLAIRDLHDKTNTNVLICGIKKNGVVSIPTPNTVINENDTISFIAASRDTSIFYRKLGYDGERIKDISIIGGSKLGMFLARRAIDAGMNVKIVDNNMKRCKFLLREVPDARVICGDGTDMDLLEEEGILESSAIVSATEDDATNTMISMYATRMSPNSRVVTKIKKSDFEEMLDNLDVGSVFNAKYITVDRILKYVRAMQNSLENEVESVYHVIGNKVAVLEFNVYEDMPNLGKPLKAIHFKKNLLITVIYRGGKSFIPGADDVILAGDIVIAATTNENISKYSEIFA